MKFPADSLKRSFALFGCTALLCAGVAWGQGTNSADVTGSVTDPSGAVVPGVTVTVKDLDKNVERTFITNSSGVYDTGPLVPEDRYIILFKNCLLYTSDAADE